MCKIVIEKILTFSSNGGKKKTKFDRKNKIYLYIKRGGLYVAQQWLKLVLVVGFIKHWYFPRDVKEFSILKPKIDFVKLNGTIFLCFRNVFFFFFPFFKILFLEKSRKHRTR
ncbi:hypothetical protein GDO86_013740 [Hymenochirus boettgeri]|uniref:Uncharacterized protein n=1 Tax=Hymenochirus boettgeri TaxID=247094 RepID=A0A8T2JQB1_9PIPI|nr:hypothetical protein GDO86_013740 [Hymenochirus boettgeri]